MQLTERHSGDSEACRCASFWTNPKSDLQELIGWEEWLRAHAMNIMTSKLQKAEFPFKFSFFQDTESVLHLVRLHH